MGKTLDGSERIVCVPMAAMRRAGGLSGFQGDRGRMLEVLDEILPDARVLPRTAALESDPSWLQLIAYGVLTCRGKVFAYRRRKAGTEGRLHGKASLGIGGHVDSGDRQADCPVGISQITIQNAMMREVREEVGPPPGLSLHLAGLLHDDRDPVGRVHLGIVYEVRLGSIAIEAKAEVEPLGWFDPGALRDVKGMEWEGWSGLLIDHWLSGLGVVLAGSSG